MTAKPSLSYSWVARLFVRSLLYCTLCLLLPCVYGDGQAAPTHPPNMYAHNAPQHTACGVAPCPCRMVLTSYRLVSRC